MKLLTRVDNDVYGNPRYISHCTSFIKENEDFDYDLAFKRAKKLGYKKYRKKNFEFFFVCTTYTPILLQKEIKKIQQWDENNNCISNNLKVYRYTKDEEDYWYIGDVQFKPVPLGECYTEYGETLSSVYGDKIDKNQIVQALTFWNGFHNESVIVDNEKIPYFIEDTVEQLEEEEAEKILQNLPKPSVDSYIKGVSVIKNNGYSYHFHLYNHWETCTVYKI